MSTSIEQGEPRPRPAAYSTDTRVGTFWITFGLDRRWHVIWDGEDLGSYDSPEDAAKDAHAGAVPRSSLANANAEHIVLPRMLGGWTLHP